MPRRMTSELIDISTMAKTRKAKSQKTDKSGATINVSEEEQWRLIRESGILKKVSETASFTETKPGQIKDQKDELNDEEWPLAEEIFAAVTIIVPMSFLLLLMYILIHFQYGQQPQYGVIAERMISGVPILSIFIFYTNRHKRDRYAQSLLFILAIVVGTRMIHQVNYGSWLKNMQQCPPLGTLWVYSIVQLDLGLAVLSLCAVGIWVWWTGMKLVF
ncbi:hypothetical protein EW146_g2944 [Bondarzewia mesenterica]|uniref:DUF7719 domain-containing protein n=1 Tax=Bondarzewia mesenterica TaxID=1095465 RepID=A0A4S4LZA4_9AGAM|nr:hypothetical protein EW146_g2944 [Bondarzewia mesenterica]